MYVKEDHPGMTTQEGLYRAAFPAFRVFIYGFEISPDVVEVRVNQAGGSQDRAPATCSFTLVNPNDRYLVDHADMIAYANDRDMLAKDLKANAGVFKEFNEILTGDQTTESTEIRKYLSTLGAAAEGDEIARDIEELYAAMRAGGHGYQADWTSTQVYDQVKYKVFEDKLKQVVKPFETDVDRWKRTDGEGVLMPRYHYQEGDCIFHVNDPVRIAYRDPFNTRVWYWSFTGFVDGFTEDVGVNQESLVTITCTDVSKVPRYALVHMDTGILDAGLQANEGASVGPRTREEFFAGFSILDILESLFFGFESFKGNLDNTAMRTAAYLGANEQKVFIGRYYTSLTTDEIDAMTPIERNVKIKKYYEAKVGNTQGDFIKELTTPHGVAFKRCDLWQGVEAFFIGDVENPDHYDMIFGTTISPNNLKELNDKLHHRVRVSDLDTMMKDGADASTSVAAWTAEAVITEIGTNIEKYPVGAGRVFYIAPATLGAQMSFSVLDESPVGSIALHSSYRDRLSFLYDLAERIEFCCYATPKGDFVFEMPFYDFNPWDFDQQDSQIRTSDIQESLDYNQETYALIQDYVQNGKYSETELLKMMKLADKNTLLAEGFDLDALEESISPEAFKYRDTFTIEKSETLGFSNSMNDGGMKSAFRAMPKISTTQKGMNTESARQYVNVYSSRLHAILGLRVGEEDPWAHVTTQDGGYLFAALGLRRANAEARNLGLQILPAFGLMVNRPLYWRQRNYIGNIVSCQHSMVVNSSCDSVVNINQVRGWTGSLDDESYPMFEHFGGDAPFNFARILKNQADQWGQAVAEDRADSAKKAERLSRKQTYTMTSTNPLLKGL